MKKYSNIITCALSYILFFNVCIASEQVQVASCDTCACFQVKLAENPTTGFQWTLKSYDQTYFSAVKDEYIVSNPKLMGSPGTHIFYFKQKDNTTCPESTVLCFSHARAWEASDSGHCTEVTVHFSKKSRLKEKNSNEEVIKN